MKELKMIDSRFLWKMVWTELRLNSNVDVLSMWSKHVFKFDILPLHDSI